MFFRWCSYLNSCSNLMICSLKFKKEFLALKMMLLILCFEAFNLYPIQVVISLPWWIKHTMRQLLIFFLWKCLSFFSYVGGALVFNFFSVILFDKHILAIQQTITHEEDLWHSFWSVTICWTAAEALVPWSKQQKMAKKSFYDVCSVQPPQIFHVQVIISTVRPVFPDYLSVSYDYTSRNHWHSNKL